MNFIFISIIMRLKLILNYSFIFVIIVFLIISFFISIIMHKENRNLTIGIMYIDDNVSNYIVDSFTKNIVDGIEVIKYDNLENMQKDITNGSLEMAYLITEQVENNNFNKTIQAYKSTFTSTDQLLNVLMASSIIQAKSGEIGYGVLRKYFNDDKGEIVEFINTSTDSYLKNGLLMNLDTAVIANKNYTTVESNTSKNIIYGLLSLIILVEGAVSAKTISNKAEKNVFAKIKYYGVGMNNYLLGNNIAIFLVCFVTSLIYLFICRLLFKDLIFNTALELIYCTIYIISITSFSCFINTKFNLKNYADSILIFLFISTILFSGSFFNIQEIFNNISILRYIFIPHYYVDGLLGNNIYFNFMVMLLTSFLFILLQRSSIKNKV